MKITNYWILLLCLTAWSCGDGSSITYSPIEQGSGSQLEELLAESVPDSALRSAMASRVASESAVPDTAALWQVTQLSASGMGIRSLVGIDLLTSLQALDVSENAIDDVTPLRGLLALELLDLAGNNVADISPLGSLHQLSVVVLDANPVSDLGPLLGLPVLAELSILGVTTQDSVTIRELEQRGVSVLSDLSAPASGNTPIDLSEMAPRAIAAAGSLWFVAGSSRADAGPVIAVSRNQGETWSVWSDAALVDAGVQRIDHLAIVVASTDTVAMFHSRTGWFRSLDSGVSWRPPTGLPSGFGFNIPIVFPEVTLAARNNEPSWMTTLPGPELLRSEDVGATWSRSFGYIWDHSFEAVTGQLIFAQRGSIFRSFSP